MNMVEKYRLNYYEKYGAFPQRWLGKYRHYLGIMGVRAIGRDSVDRWIKRHEPKVSKVQTAHNSNIVVPEDYKDEADRTKQALQCISMLRSLGLQPKCRKAKGKHVH